MSDAKTFEAKISSMGDSIASLTLKEAVELAEYMKEKYGIEPSAGGAVMMASGDGGGAAVEGQGFIAAAAGPSLTGHRTATSSSSRRRRTKTCG